MIKALFFDLDGTLVNTHEANYLAYSDAIGKETGIEASPELRTHIASGLSSHEFIPLVAPGASAETIANINAKKKELYPQYVPRSVLNENLVELLRSFSGTLTTVLVTTAKRDNGLAVLNHHGVADYFSHRIFGDDVTRMKPDPEAYTLALKTAGVEAGEALAFEDSDSGVAAARAAGISVVRIKEFLL